MSPAPPPKGYWIAVAGALLLYALLAAVGAVRNADQINPDGVSYIRLAGYLVEGRFEDSVSSCWSPLVSWSMAPLLACGVDGLHAARIALALWGAVLVLAAGRLAQRFAPPHAFHAFVILSIIALMAAQQATARITPDIILGACVIVYFRSATRRDLLSSRRAQFASGVCGGLAYLAKAYALPFFLAHVAFTVGLRHLLQEPEGESRRRPSGRTLTALATALLGFAVIAGPWAGVLTWKYGRLTFGSAGAINHALIGPDRVEGAAPYRYGLWTPPPGRIAIWEVPETLAYHDWSMFDSVRNFRHQCALIAENVAALREMLLSYDIAGVSLCLLVFAPVLAFLLRDDAHWRWCALWYAGTIVIYCAGYAVVRGSNAALEDRYVIPVVWPVVCICGPYLLLSLLDRLHPKRSVAATVTAILLISLSLRPADRLARTLWAPRAAPYRAMARDLARAGCRGPIASTDRFKGLYVAYHMREAFLGTPRGSVTGDCARELDEHGTDTFLIWRGSSLWDAFDSAPSWKLQNVMTDPASTPIKAYRRTR